MYLGEGERRRLQAARRELGRALFERRDYDIALADQLTSLLPGSWPVVYRLSSTGGLRNLVGAPRHVGLRVPGFARYRLAGADAFANRVVTTRELFRRAPDALARTRQELWSFQSFWYQLRVVLYEQDRATAMVALLRERRAGDYRDTDGAVLASLLRTLRDGFRVSRATRGGDRSAGCLGTTLDAFDEPAFLVNDRGHVLFANLAARAAFRELPPWLATCVRSSGRSTCETFARVVQVDLWGRAVWLVLPRLSVLGAQAPDPVTGRVALLPPSLVSVAALLAEGLTDKEIATRLVLTLATERTYVARVYRRLGVRSRRELIRSVPRLADPLGRVPR